MWVERSPEQEKMNRASLIVGHWLSLQGEGGVRHKPAPKKAMQAGGGKGTVWTLAGIAGVCSEELRR